MTILTDEDLDQLALDGCDMVVYQDGSVVSYDVAGYDRILRRELSPRLVPVRRAQQMQPAPMPPQARFAELPYLVRNAGFRRGRLFGPDEIGAKFRSLGIAFNDGLGNGLYESLLINRKFGLHQTFESPSKGLPIPYLDQEFEVYPSQYEGYLDEFLARFSELEPVNGGPLVAGDPSLVVFILGDTPLGVFSRVYRRAPEALHNELEGAIGRSVPPVYPQTPADRLALIRFWNYVWAKHARILEIRISAARRKLGANLLALGNFHELPHLDQVAFGQCYDYPAVAVRPLLLEDELMLRYYTAYWTQMVYNLSGKPPIVSLRNTLSAAGCRFVPGAELNRAWYDQAVRHGAGAFYLWTRDYPMDVKDPYDGPIIGNPVSETLPEERWQANLDVLGQLSVRQRFIPPEAQVGILVPLKSAWLNRQAWRRIYAAFSAAAEAQVHTRFVSDVQIEKNGLPGEIKLLLVPELEFLSTELQVRLEGFMQTGGVLRIVDHPLFNQEARPLPPLEGVRSIERQLLEIFPLDRPAALQGLQSCAEELRQWVREAQADPMNWVFEVTCENLPPTATTWLSEPDSSIEFRAWLYEHGSDWIYPYIKS
jgi:hypothetical protein